MTGTLSQLFLFAAASLATAATGQLLANPYGHGAAIALPGGIYLAVLLMSEARSWPRWTLIALTADFVMGVSLYHNTLPDACFDAIGHAAGGIVAAGLVRRFCGSLMPLDTPRRVLALIMLAAVPSATISATVEAIMMAPQGAQTAGVQWLLHWTGYALGGLIVAPLVLTAHQSWNAWKQMSTLRWGEAAVLAVLLTTVVSFIFSSRLPLVFLTLLPMLWVALRFGMFATSLATALFAFLALYYTAAGLGPYAGTGYTPKSSALMVQSLLVFASIGALLLEAV